MSTVKIWRVICNNTCCVIAESEKIEEIHAKYLNRLSDYLFMLSRWITFDKKANEIPWKAKM